MGSSLLISITQKICCLKLGKTLIYILRPALTFGTIQLMAEVQKANTILTLFWLLRLYSNTRLQLGMKTPFI